MESIAQRFRMRHFATATMAKLGAVLVIVFFLAIFQVAMVRAGAVTARIVSVEHPGHVLLGQVFNITAVAEYSDALPTDIGVWNSQNGALIQSLTLTNLIGPGIVNFTFQLKAPSPPSEWHLNAVTRVWWQDAWYEDPNGGSKSFTITISDSVTLGISSEAIGSTVQVDTSHYNLDGTKLVFVTMKPGMHVMEASRIVQGEHGERFVFIGWSDAVNSNPRQILVAKNMNITALYRTEYFLSVSSDMGKVTGEGWYEQGSEANFGALPASEVQSWLGLYTQDYRFSNWSGDSASKESTASIIMDSAKNVQAQWVSSGIRFELRFVAVVFFLGALPLAVRGLSFYMKRGRSNTTRPTKAVKHSMKVLLLLSIFVLALTILPSAQAQLPTQSNASIVKIGDAYWYYWNKTESDTCLLWLGGGISQQSGNNYWINPFDYESFGTIRFLQDLSKYYCVIALQKGSSQSFNPIANRTIYQEPYQPQSPIIPEIHNWIENQGYQHTYLVGYSVGAQVAAFEAIVHDPTHWTGQDGLILITVPLANDVIEQARNIQTNLLLLYSDNLPDFEATGQQLYSKAPADRWQGSYYFHKELHVLPNVGHEVWTLRETGAYLPDAANIIVAFIEKSKALQFSTESNSLAGIISATGNQPIEANGTIIITSVQAPARVAPEDNFFVEVNVNYRAPTMTDIAAVAYNTGLHEIASVSTVTLTGSGDKLVRLVVPRNSNTTVTYPESLSLSVILLQRAGEKWSLMAGPYPARTMVTDIVTLRFESPVPNLSLRSDLGTFMAQPDGKLRLELSRGTHYIQVPSIVYVNNVTRFVFSGWDDQTNFTTRRILLDNDTTITAAYRKQYFVNAGSPYGTAAGTGWYDENATASVSIHPLLVGQPPAIFAHWSGDSNEESATAILTVGSPKTVQAVWSTANTASESIDLETITLVALSVLAFALLLTWNLRHRNPAQAS